MTTQCTTQEYAEIERAQLRKFPKWQLFGWALEHNLITQQLLRRIDLEFVDAVNTSNTDHGYKYPSSLVYDLILEELVAFHTKQALEEGYCVEVEA